MADSGLRDAVKLLLQSGAGMDFYVRGGETDYSPVDWLLQQPLSANTLALCEILLPFNTSKINTLIWLVQHQDQEAPLTTKGIDMLVKNGTNVNALWKESDVKTLWRSGEYHNNEGMMCNIYQFFMDFGLAECSVICFVSTTQVLECLKMHGVNLNIQNCKGQTALHGNLSPDRLSLLLSQGASADLRDDQGQLPSHAAVLKRQPPRWEDLRRLIESQSEGVHAKTNSGLTYLHLARLHTGGDRMELVKNLLGIGADPNTRAGHPPSMGQTAVHLWLQEDKLDESLEIYFDHPGFEPNVADENGTTYLHLACALGRMDRVRRLLDLGADPTAQDRKGNFVLTMAKDLEIPRLLLQNPLLQRWVSTSSQVVRRQISYFSRDFAHLPIAGKLLELMTNPNVIDANGEALLHEITGQPSVLREITDQPRFEYLLPQLIRHPNFNPNTRTTLGKTGLMSAVLSGNWEYIPILLEGGADPNIRNESGDTALHQICRFSYNRLNHGPRGESYFFEKLVAWPSIDIEARNHDGQTSLHVAYIVHSGQSYQARELLKYGADPEALDNNGNTPQKAREEQLRKSQEVEAQRLKVKQEAQRLKVEEEAQRLKIKQEAERLKAKEEEEWTPDRVRREAKFDRKLDCGWVSGPYYIWLPVRSWWTYDDADTWMMDFTFYVNSGQVRPKDGIPTMCQSIRALESIFKTKFGLISIASPFYGIFFKDSLLGENMPSHGKSESCFDRVFEWASLCFGSMKCMLRFDRAVYWELVELCKRSEDAARDDWANLPKYPLNMYDHRVAASAADIRRCSSDYEKHVKKLVLLREALKDVKSFSSSPPVRRR